MSKIIFYLAGILALILCGWGLVENPGSISITWFGYVIETSVAFCICLILVVALAIHLLLFPFRWIRWIRFSLEKKRLVRAKDTLVQILNNVFCNNLSDNEKLIKKFQKQTINDQDLVLMLKALSKADAAVYKDLTKDSKTEQTGWEGLIKEHIKRGEIVQASEQMENLLKKNPKTDWILKEAFTLFTLNAEWKKALSCLETLRKIGSISNEDYDYQKATLLVKMNKGDEAFKLCPALPAAALSVANLKPQKAEKIYRESWKACPSFEVYRAFVKLYIKENSLAQYKHVLKLCESNPDAKLNALVTADAAINANLWSEAKKELNAYLANYPLTADIAIKMAQIEFYANHNIHEAQKWIDKMSNLGISGNYICTHCGHKTNDWIASCPICNTFAGLKAS